MKAVILAAGMPHESFPRDDKQKTLYKFNGEVLLERTVNQLREAGIKDVRVVIGYGAAMGAGVDGDILEALGWWEGHLQELGWALTAGLIASGSAGLRLGEKWLSPKIAPKAPLVGN